MGILKLVDANAPPVRRYLLAAAGLAGVSSTGILALVNVAAREIADSGYDMVDWPLAGLFVLALVVYYVSESFLLNRIAAAVETALDGIRRRLLDGIRRADFEKLERRGGADVGSIVAGDIAVISQISQYLAIGFRSTVLLVVLTIYLAWLSMAALILVAGVIVAAAIVYLRRGKRLEYLFKRAQQAEEALTERIRDLLDGCKEIRMWQARSRDLGADFADTANSVEKRRAQTQVFSFEQYIFGSMTFFFVLAAVVFVLPSYVSGMEKSIVQVTTTVLFLIGPVSIVVLSMTILAEANSSAVRLMRLEADLAHMRDLAAERPEPPFNPDFEEIRFVRGVYAYQADLEERSFAVGPLDVAFRRGEISFVTGGNGSGKTTLVRILCGLYRLQQGYLTVDGRRVMAAAIQPYRNLIAPVFSDYHLFRASYGLEGATPERVYELLAWMKLDHVTGYHDGRFDTVDLSAGQRKRLALVVAILEDRPIIVLDEWAADQDPGFRRIFYREVLPQLKSQGKTVIAVTHDDHYFDAADRRIHMEEGRIVEDHAAGTGKGGPF